MNQPGPALAQVCTSCGELKDTVEDFSRRGGAKRHTVCKACHSAYKKALLALQRQNPALLAAMRERQNATQRRWRAANPEKGREYQRRYREKIKSDPGRHAAYLERRRMEYRLRRERKGAVIFDLRPGPTGKPIKGTITARPLAAKIDWLIAQREAGNLWDVVTNETDHSKGMIERVCEELGTSPRNVLEWRTGRRRRVQFDIAEGIVSRSPWHWWDVWNETTVPDPAELARVTVLFEGEQVAA